VVNSEHFSIEPVRQKLMAEFTYGGIAEFKLTHYRAFPALAREA
jgi:hypothetical protein